MKNFWYNIKHIELKSSLKNILCVLLIVILCIQAAIIGVTLKTQKAYAYQTVSTHSWKTTITSNITTSGSIQITEERIIDITPFIEKAKKYQIGSSSNAGQSSTNKVKLSPLVWNFNNFPEEATLSVNSSKIAIFSNEDTIVGNWVNIGNSEFKKSWYGNEGPNTEMCTYDDTNKQMCLFSKLTNADQYSEQQCFEVMEQMTGINNSLAWNMTKAVLLMNYTVEKAATIYKDVADISWIYVSDTWDKDAYDVNLSVNIPVGAASIANPLGKVTDLEGNPESTTERNIYAWGHGSSTGIVNLDPNGTVSLKNDIVPGHTDAELRIVFPSAWLSNLDKSSNISHVNQTKLTTILKEESVWRDYRTDAVNKMLIPIGFTGICLIFMAILLIFSWFYRRRFFTDAVSLKDMQGLHPCILYRLKNWNRERRKDLIVAIFNLENKGLIRIEKKSDGDYKIVLNNPELAKNPYSDKSLDIVDIRTINLLFTGISCKNHKLSLLNFKNYAKARSFDFMGAYMTWHSLLTDQVNEFANFKSIYDKVRHIFYLIGFAIAIISVVVGVVCLEWITPIVGIFTGFLMFFSANGMRNKVFFKDNDGKFVEASKINTGIINLLHSDNKEFAKYVKNLIKDSVLAAQDNLSKNMN